MSEPERSSAERLGYRPGLDGLRGLSILGVLLFHAELPFAPGGFLGVSVFYTLSGFLITSLLLDSTSTGGPNRLSGFWLRRARRLLPAALLGLLLATVVGAAGADPDQLSRLREDVLWALGYALNWRLVFEDYSYGLLFSDPSPVQHFWSLAIEGQLYLVVPLFVGMVGRLPGRGGGYAACALAAASAGLSAWLYQEGATTDRIYYGTDTRAAELLAGCALALLRRGTVRTGATHANPRLRSGLELGALAAVLTSFGWVSLDAAWLYRGGLGLFSLLSVSLVLAGLHGQGAVGRTLASRPLVELGRISYGVYVYHWPVFLLLPPERLGWSAAATVCLRIAVSIALAWLSERFVERPVRRAHALGWLPTALGAAAGTAAVVAVLMVSTPGAEDGEARSRPIAASERIDGLRVAMFGDSTMLTLRTGLGPWLRERGAEVLEGVSLKGCGLIRHGSVRLGEDELGDRRSCHDRARKWRNALSREPTDLAIVLVGPWDALPRRLADGDSYRQPGDPVLDARFEGEVLAAIDLLSRNGTRVVWLTTPRSAHVDAKPKPFHLYNEGVDRLNAILREIAAQRSDAVRIVDLAAYVAADRERAVDADLRADGVHWTVRGARPLSRDWLGPEVLAALRELR